MLFFGVKSRSAASVGVKNGTTAVKFKKAGALAEAATSQFWVTDVMHSTPKLQRAEPREFGPSNESRATGSTVSCSLDAA